MRCPFYGTALYRSLGLRAPRACIAPLIRASVGGHVLRLAILATATKVRSRPAAARLSGTLHAFGKRSHTQPRATACSATEVRSLASCSSKAAFSAVLRFGNREEDVPRLWRGTRISPPFLPKGGCLGTKRKRLPRRVSGVKHTSQAAVPDIDPRPCASLIASPIRAGSSPTNL